LEWKQLHATFGHLDSRELTLRSGFNLIYAPNESGKSTWCAFLRTMLYGFPARSRGEGADKNRYAPWSGKSMEGSADLIANGSALTITRQTARAGNPMASFSATYTGTSTPVPGLSGSNCGELLTGVPREVFERSAFIAQNSMVIDQDTELERRITALLSSGDEGLSYTEAAERLKKQLHQRRYNKNGQLPALEQELLQIGEQLERSRSLQEQIRQLHQQLLPLEQQEEHLLQQLANTTAQGETDTHREYALLQAQAEQADALVRQYRLDTGSLPSRSELSALKSAAGSILVNQLTERNARAQLQLRRQEREQAELEVDTFPLFASLTGKEAKEQADADRRRWRSCKLRKKLFLAAPLLPLVLSLCILLERISLPGWTAVLPLLLIPLFLSLAAVQNRRAAKLLSAYGDSQADFSRQADAYYIIYEKFAACRKAEEDTRQRAEHLSAALQDSREEIVAQARVFDPAVSDLSSATASIDRAIALWKRLEAARQTQEQLYERCEILGSVLGDAAGTSGNSTRLKEQLTALRQQQKTLRFSLAAAQSELQRIGDPAALEEMLLSKKQAHTALQTEYDALSLALAALSDAHTALQNRFSPELGKKSAKYFAKLTKGKYNTILLSKDLQASVRQESSPVSHPFWQLSQGTTEQLYLAVRLAICESVLPADKSVPLVLDDALCSFDDARMAAALDLLMEIAEHRQVLFFTCQKREAQYLRQAYPDRVFYSTL